jgi:hypothetical protein
MGPQPRVWLSYTQKDLSVQADAVVRAVEALGWIGVRAAGMPASDRPTMQAIRGAIAQCDALVAIVALLYGPVPSEEEGGDGGRNWVWLEILEAEKNGIPVLAFMLEDNVNWRPDWVETGDLGRAGLARFKAYLAQRKDYGRFFSVQDLTAQVRDSLAALERSKRELDRQSPTPSMRSGDASQVESPTPPSLPRPWFEGGVDPLLLAWRLVVDRKGDPDLLLHLDPLRMLDAIEKAEREMSQPGPGPLEAVLKRLEARQSGLAPNALWLAWMRQVHASRIEALTKEPPRPVPKANEAPPERSSKASSDVEPPSRPASRARSNVPSDSPPATESSPRPPSVADAFPFNLPGKDRPALPNRPKSSKK